MYQRISQRLHTPSLMNQLSKLFAEKQSLPELLVWVHNQIEFNKGNIPRHEDPFDIIQYGQGKCREFSILFTAACLANGYRARLILDLSDHAWTEVWNPELKRWTHIDPSEKRLDDPEMYERDWKKNLKEVYAFENGRYVNVTNAYKMRMSYVKEDKKTTLDN